MGGRPSKEGAIVGCVLMPPICVSLLKAAGIYYMYMPGGETFPLEQALSSPQVLQACVPPEAWVEGATITSPSRKTDSGPTYVAIEGLTPACVNALTDFGTDPTAHNITLQKTSATGLNVTRLTESEVDWLLTVLEEARI